MKLIYRNTRIIATATDAYDGPELFISAPDGFNLDQADSYRVIDVTLVANVPQFVSMRQARLALLGAGLLDTVNAGIGQMGQAEQIEWEYASEVRRDSALVTAMGAALNLDDAALDALFVTAATL
jgi:hypothetical protein